MAASQRMKFFWIYCLVGVWLSCVGTGFLMLFLYQFTPGPVTTVPSHWPEAANIEIKSEAFNLVVLIHPQCSCTLATLEELDKVLRNSPQNYHCHFLVFDPHHKPTTWQNTYQETLLRQFSNATVTYDLEGLEAKKFGLIVSGHVLLFDREGHNCFSGGITGSRGHVGTNAGAELLATTLETEKSKRGPYLFPTFGCSIF